MTQRTDVPFAYLHLIDDLERAAKRTRDPLLVKTLQTAALFILELADLKYEPGRDVSKRLPRRRWRAAALSENGVDGE